MGLLLVFLLLVAPVLIFLLWKADGVDEHDADRRDARRSAKESTAAVVPRKRSSKTASPGSRVVIGGEDDAAGAVIGEIQVGSHVEGGKETSVMGVARVGTGEERSLEEVGHRLEEEIGTQAEVLRAEEAGGMELGMVVADGGEGVPISAVKAEDNLTLESTDVTGRGVAGSIMEEKMPMPEDACPFEKVSLGLDEEKETPKELDAENTGMGTIKDEESLAMEAAENVKAASCATSTEVGMENEDAGRVMAVGNEKVGSSFNDDDDWEGVEKSDLQKLFGAVATFVGGDEGSDELAKLSNDLQLQLYGLYKIATEGPCFESQPMPLKLSARAKWHAWQSLGSMNPDMAMEQYISLVSENIPGWTPLKSRADRIPTEVENLPPEKGLSSLGVTFSGSSSEDQLFQKSERELESQSSLEECSSLAVPKNSAQGNEHFHSECQS